jgi:hypothetical protein
MPPHMNTVCAICGKRPAKRFCPAKGEKICAICCGEGREVTIDCPVDCSYLVAAHRYEAEHRKPIPPEEFPYPDVEFPVEFVYERWPIVTGLAGTILAFQAQNKELNDGTARLALESLAETYRTLGTGIYYERPPDSPVARALYGQINGFLQEFRKRETDRAGFSSLKDSDTFPLLVFLLRICMTETDGRPLSRAFLGFLRERFPAPAAEQEPARIIVP